MSDISTPPTAGARKTKAIDIDQGARADRARDSSGSAGVQASAFIRRSAALWPYFAVRKAAPLGAAVDVMSARPGGRKGAQPALVDRVVVIFCAAEIVETQALRKNLHGSILWRRQVWVSTNSRGPLIHLTRTWDWPARRKRISHENRERRYSACRSTQLSGTIGKESVLERLGGGTALGNKR